MKRLARALVPVALRVTGAAPRATPRPLPSSHLRVAREPLILLDEVPNDGAVIDASTIGVPGDAWSADSGQAWPGRARSPLWRVAEVVLSIGLGLAVVVAYLVSGSDTGGPIADGTSDGALRPEMSLDATMPPYPSLVAPATARPGEVMTLLGYRYRGLSGELRVFLDGAPVAHEVTATISAPYPGRDGVILTLAIPAAITPGAHELELTGPLPGAGYRGGVMGGNTEQHDGRIATTSITIAPPAPNQ